MTILSILSDFMNEYPEQISFTRLFVFLENALYSWFYLISKASKNKKKQYVPGK